MNRILELGAGKNWKNWKTTTDEVVCVDQMYTDEYNEINSNLTLIRDDSKTFLESFGGERFDNVICTRMMEHIPYEQIPYLIYLIKEILVGGGRFHFSVPDFKQVAELACRLDGNEPAHEFNRDMIAVHTEIFNEPNDPHRSIWTKNLVYYYFNLEGFWKDITIDDVMLDGRYWYLSVKATKKS